MKDFLKFFAALALLTLFIVGLDIFYTRYHLAQAQSGIIKVEVGADELAFRKCIADKIGPVNVASLKQLDDCKKETAL